MYSFFCDLTVGVISSFVTILMLHLYFRFRTFNIYKKIVGKYKEVDNRSMPKLPEDLFEVSFKRNFFGAIPELELKFTSQNPMREHWIGLYKVIAPHYYYLSGSYRFLKVKNILGHDQEDIGIHNLIITPENNTILIEQESKKYNDNHPHRYIIKKLE